MTARTDEPSLWLELRRTECEDADTLRKRMEYVRIKVRAAVLEEMATSGSTPKLRIPRLLSRPTTPVVQASPGFWNAYVG